MKYFYAICLTAFFFLPKNFLSQIKFVPGYIINDKGDTLKGEVKFNPKKEHDNYTRVTFKDVSGAQKNHKPAKIKGYGFDNRHFVSVKNNDEDMFFQRLTEGYITFYKAAFEVIVMNETSFDFEYYVVKEGDKKYTEVKENKFKKQMSDWMKDNPEYITDFKDEKKLNKEAAIEAINRYNDWKKNN
jgi:hypothetical protein